MTAPNELGEVIVRELNNVVMCDGGECEEEQRSLTSHEDTVSDDIPLSLLSYFETSKCRAALCEELILEELKDFTASHHTDAIMTLPHELDKDLMSLNMQVLCETEPVGQSSSTDTEKEELTHSFSLCEAETGECRWCEKCVEVEVRTPKCSMIDEGIRKCSQYEQKLREEQEDVKRKEEERKQSQRNFQDELRKIMEAEELHRKELELMEKRAQEKLEQEFQLQQELIKDLQRQVNEEKKKREEEEHERMKEEGEKKKLEEKMKKEEEEEDRRKREAEKNKRERHIMEARKKKEDDGKRKIEGMRLKEKPRRKEEEERRMEEEERRRVENGEKEGREEKNWIHENMREEEEERKIREIRCRHEKTSRQVEKEEMKRKEGNEEIKEMSRKHEEDTAGGMENMMERDKRRKTSEEVGLKEWRERERDDSKNGDERRGEEQRMTIEHEVRMKNEFRDLQNQEKKEEEQEIVNEEKKKGEEEKRKREKEEEEDQRSKKEEEINQREIEIERKMVGEEEIGKKDDEVEEKRREEEETTKQEVEKSKIHEDMRKKDAETRLEEMRCREEKTEGWKEEDSEVKLTERNRKCEGHETGTTENMMEEDKGRKSDEEAAVKNGDDEDKRREEEPRMAMEAEVRTKREKMKEKEEEEKRKVALNMIEQMKRNEKENGETEDDNKKNTKIVEERHRECKEERNEEEKATNGKENKQWREKEQKMEELRPEEENELNKMREVDNREIFQGGKTEDKEKRQEEVKREKEGDELRYKDGRSDIKGEEEHVRTEERQVKEEKESEKGERPRLHEQKREKDCMKTQITTESLTSQVDNGTTPTSSNPGPSQRPNQSKSSPSSSETVQQDQRHAAVTPHTSLPGCFPEHAEQKRLSWMKDCIPWTKLSQQNKSKQKRSADSRRRASRASECDSLPPVCPHTVLQSTGCRSLQQVTTVTLEDLPGCCLSTLAQCSHLQSLTVRRCGLKSLEGINHLQNLCCVDVQENDISFVDCGNMTSLRVLQLGHNKLTSIHGLSGAENLHVLDLSHNFISRIAGLESVRQLQSLSLGHNQLISTKGLRDVSTLLHLDCSHNHLAVVEGLENNALLHTLDLKSNNITEPPRLVNHVLLRELHLDDNSISSLLGLAVCWLPLMQHLSAAQNRITLLPSMSDFVCLANLDLRFNCLSELHNVCESVQGCQFLREVHLTGNPLQQESGWRSVLQKAVAGLRTIDGKETDSLLSAPAAQQVSLASGSFLTFCQAQLKQTRDLQQQHSKELSNASSPLDAVKCSCRHFSDTLKLAVEQRFAHEYGDTTVSTGQTGVEKTTDMGRVPAEMCAECSDVPTLEKELPIIQSGDNMNCKYLIPEEKSTTEKSFHFLRTNETPASFLEMAPEFDQHELDSKSTAAAVIQQQWRKYREKCGNISCPPTAEKGGGGVGDRGEPDSGSSNVDRSIVEQDYAATTIQAFWRGFILRRRLASAFAVVTWPDSSEDETFEEVDVDGFVFDEAAEEKRWRLSLSEDSSSSGHHRVSEQPLSLKPLRASPVPPHYTTPSTPFWRPKQAWVEQVDPTGERTSPESSNRHKSPAAASVLGGLPAKSEKIVKEWGFKDSKTALLMLKRAQKMKSKKQQQKIHQDPFVCQQGPVETRNRSAPHRRNHMKVSAAELSPQQAKQMEKAKQKRTQQWINFQSDRDSESERFLPEISSDILNGGRVQLVADPGYCEHLHHTSGLWASSSSAAQLSKERNYLRRNSASRPTGKEVPTPKRANSAPLKKDRISFRDNPVQLSGGWGGGKKRVKGQVHK